MVLSQKAKNIFNRLCMCYVTDNFIANYDFFGYNYMHNDRL